MSKYEHAQSILWDALAREVGGAFSTYVFKQSDDDTIKLMYAFFGDALDQHDDKIVELVQAIRILKKAGEVDDD